MNINVLCLNFRLQRDKTPITLPSTGSSTEKLENRYIEAPRHPNRPVRPPSVASSSPSNQKLQFERSNRRGSSSTLNSGSAMQQSQDSFKKQDIISTGSESRFSSLPSSQPAYHRTSRDSLGNRRLKTVNPSLSSVSSGSTETADRYQATPFLSSQVEEVGLRRKYERPTGAITRDTYVIL